MRALPAANSDAEDPPGEVGLGRWLGPRGARAAWAAIAVLPLCGLAALDVPGRLARWVQDRPVYAWSIEEIELDPPPPTWLRTGRDGLLADARPALEGLEGTSALALDLGAVARAFKNHTSVVERVERIERSYPDRIAARLRYRRPVAFAVFESEPKLNPADVPPTSISKDSVAFVLDGEGVILGSIAIRGAREHREPHKGQLAPSILDSGLIHLGRIGLSATTEPGQRWSRLTEDGGSEGDPVVLDATRLARWLLERAEVDGWPEVAPGDAIRIRQIKEREGSGGRFLVFLARERSPDDPTVALHWGRGPGLEEPGEPVAERKWQLLSDWIRLGGFPRESGILRFAGDRVEWRAAEPSTAR